MKKIKAIGKRILARVINNSFATVLYATIFKCIGLLPVNKKLVMFESFLGKQFSCNPRAIYEYMQKNHAEYEMYWSVDKNYLHEFKDKKLPFIKRFSIKWFFYMARARYWVTNSRLPLWIPKPGHTIYLQTWHGTPLKRLAADMDEVHMANSTTEKYKKDFIKEAKNWDYLVSPNEYSTEIFKSAFHFNKNVIESGYPRNDYLYQCNNNKEIQAIKYRLGIPVDKKVILYAPTWRDNQFYGTGRYKFDLELDLSQMKDELGQDFVIILRMHYLVAENFDLSPYQGFAYDFSNHEDIRELYLISDILITDYSSVFFDFANLKRPMIFFVYDIEEYRDKLRGFYFDFEEKAPGPLVRSSEDVIKEIKKYAEQNFEVLDNLEIFYNKFCYLESGQSTQRVVDKVFNE